MDTALVQESAGIGALGVQWSAFLFQILNFAILLGLLRAFAYKPILGILERRRQTIEESLQNAATIETTKIALDKEKQAVLTEARQHAERIIEGSKQQANKLIAAAEETARTRADQLVAQAEAQIEQATEVAREELKAEAVELVVAATEKIIDVKLDPEKDAELIQAALTEAAK